MRLARTFFLVALAGAALLARADDDLFQKGLAAYQNKQYAEARDDFQKLLAQGLVNASILHNLALADLQLDQKPVALALWRKALAMQPNYRPARLGRDFLETKMQLRPLERDSLSLWAHRNLESLSLYEMLWLNAFLLAVAGGLWLRYWSERSAALAEERPLPVFPAMPILFALLFVVSLTGAALKLRDGWNERATVTAAKTSARSLPADDGVGLFDLSGGSEVLVRRQGNGWAQIQSGDGVGWVKDGEILITSER